MSQYYCDDELKGRSDLSLTMKLKYLDQSNCKALLPKDEFNIVVHQLDEYLDNINNGGSGHEGLIDELIQHNKKSTGKLFRLIQRPGLIDICLSVVSITGNNRVQTLNSVIKILPNEPIKFQLEFNNENGTYWKVIIPMQYLLKEWGDADKGFQCYHHTIVENIKPAVISKTTFGMTEKNPTQNDLENLKQYTYFGITGRNWLQRLTEHLGEMRRGSNKKFHHAWRELIGMQDVLYTSTLVNVNYTYDKAMEWEEWAVDNHGTVASPHILNMIAGGLKGLRELHKLGITKRVNITLKERDRAIEEYAKRYPRKGIPAPWMKEYWKEYENYKNYIDKRSDTLSVDQVRQIRTLNKMGWSPDEIVEEVGARNVRQVKDVISGKYYSDVKDESK